MTQEQQTIINNLIDQFNKVNNGSKYFDITPLIEQRDKVSEEKSKCLDVFNATLDAYRDIVYKQFDDLANDLRLLRDVHITSTSPQHIHLMYGNKTLIQCTLYSTQKQLSDGTYCAYGVGLKYYANDKSGSFWGFDSFEELVESYRFKDIITKYL